MIPVPLLLKLAGPALIAAIAIGAAYATPLVGFKAQIHRIDESRDKWRRSSEEWTKAADGWQASFRASDANRTTEQRQAVTALTETANACEVRMKTARKSASAIRSIVNREPTYDASHCPQRSTVDAASLRDAISPTH